MNTLVESSPYVVTGVRLEDYASVRQEAVPAFRRSLIDGLRQMGKDVVYIDESEMRAWMNDFCQEAKKADLPVISMDRLYVPGDGVADYLDLSRAVARQDKRFVDAGYAPRPGNPPPAEQFGILGKKYRGRQVAVMDDVLFSGNMAAWIVDELAARDVEVAAFGCGVAIGEGIATVERLGVPIRAGRTFDEVEDEIVEIDFTALPGSGRKDVDDYRCYPYFDPDVERGDPTAWASIPKEQAEAFGALVVRSNMDLFRPETLFAANFVGYGEGTIEDVLSRRLQQMQAADRVGQGDAT